MVVLGRVTKKFKRYKLKKDEEFKNDISFSIVSDKRTLDLEAPTEVERRLFLAKLKALTGPAPFEYREFVDP